MKLIDRLIALNASTLATREWAVATVLARHADDHTGECWPSVKTIASSCNMGERTVREAIGELERLGIIELVRRSKGRSSHRFRLRLDLLSPSTNPADTAGLEADQPGEGRKVEPGSSRMVGAPTRQMPPGNPADGAPQPCGSCSATTKEQTREHHHQRRNAPARNGDTLPAVDAGGGGGFDGDLDAAVARLRDLHVNGADVLALQAGSQRAVEWVARQAKADGVKNPSALAVKLIRAGEKPPEGWEPKTAKRAASEHPAALGDRAAEAAKHQLDGMRKKAELALIAKFPDIADAAVERFIAKGGELAELVAKKPTAHERRTHPIPRAAILAAIKAETGETAQPEPRNHTERHTRARKAATC